MTDLDEHIERAASYTRNMDLEREPAPGGAKFMVIEGLLSTGRQVDRERARELVDRSIRTQLSTGELSFGDRDYYTGPIGIVTSALEFYDRTGDERYLDACERHVEYARSAPRCYNGGITHTKGMLELWVDTMYIMVPPIAQLGERTGDPDLFDEAATQQLAHAEVLQDDRTGLYRHMWREEPNDYPEGTFWGRGNGWAAAGILEVIESIPDDHPDREALVDLLNHQLDTAVELQDESGYWWNVLDDDRTFPETSVTTILAYVLRRGIDIGIVPEEYAEAADRAFDAVVPTPDEEGMVRGATYVTTHDPNEQHESSERFSPSGYAQGWYLKTASYFRDEHR